MEIKVDDTFIDSAILTYNNANTFTSETPFKLYADVLNDNVVYVPEGSSSSNVDFSKLKYGFKWNTGNEFTTQTLTTEFSVQDSSGISLDGLYSFNANESGSGGLVFKNFPRVGTDGGILVKMRIFSGSMENFNIHYMWDDFSGIFKQTQNENLSAEIYFKIYGLKLTIVANTQTQNVGNLGSTVDILSDSSTAESELFNVKIEPASSSNGSATRSIDNLQKILTTYLDKDYLFEKTATALAWQEGKALKYAKDFVNSEDVIFRFYVGSNSAANALKISVPVEGATNQYTQVASYTHTFISPYVVDFVTDFEMPSSNVTFANASYVGMCYDESGNALTDSDADPNEGKVGSLTQARIDKIKNISITIDDISSLNSYGVANPIIVNSDNTLTFKVVPVQSYTAVLSFKLTTNTDEVIERKVEITVTNKFTNNDLSIGTKVDAVEGQTDEYYYINAGFTNIYSVAINGETIISKGIVVSGALAENLVNIADNGVTITFADIYDSSVAQVDRINANTHMKNTSWNTTSKAFTIYSDDLKDQKSVVITLVFTFNDGGKYIYEKTIVVMPNIQVEIAIDSIKEGDEINLLNCFKKGGEVLDLYTDYDQTKVDNTKAYCKNSFNIDTQNVFVDSQYEDIYAVSVKSGAYNACGGLTTIGFYYIVNNKSDVYTLYFEFDVLILRQRFTQNDFSVVTKKEGSTPAEISNYIVAGKEYSVSNGGIVLSGALLDNIANITSINISYADNYDELVPIKDRVEAEKHMINTLWANQNFSLSSSGLSKQKTVVVTIEFTFGRGIIYTFKKELTIEPNIEIKFEKTTVNQSEKINLLQMFTKGNEQIDILSNYDKEATDNTQKYCPASFEIDESKFTIESYDNEYRLVVKEVTGLTTIGFYYIVNNNISAYTLYFKFNVEIVA